jgi:hypothetical protein
MNNKTWEFVPRETKPKATYYGERKAPKVILAAFKARVGQTIGQAAREIAAQLLPEERDELGNTVYWESFTFEGVRVDSACLWALRSEFTEMLRWLQHYNDAGRPTLMEEVELILAHPTSDIKRVENGKVDEDGNPEEDEVVIPGPKLGDLVIERIESFGGTFRKADEKPLAVVFADPIDAMLAKVIDPSLPVVQA